MKRVKEARLGDIIHAMLREDGLETPLNEYRATEAWSKVMGPTIERYTGDVTVRAGVLHVQIRNAALRQELMMQRTSLVPRINQEVGAQVIQQIVFQ